MAGKRSHVDQIFALVLVILVIGVVTDLIIRIVNQRLFAWNELMASRPRPRQRPRAAERVARRSSTPDGKAFQAIRT